MSSRKVLGPGAHLSQKAQLWISEPATGLYYHFISPFRKNHPLQIKVNEMRTAVGDADATKRKGLQRDELSLPPPIKALAVSVILKTLAVPHPLPAGATWLPSVAQQPIVISRRRRRCRSQFKFLGFRKHATARPPPPPASSWPPLPFGGVSSTVCCIVSKQGLPSTPLPLLPATPFLLRVSLLVRSPS